MVKNIPDSLTFPFTVWMAENGFYPCTKKNFLVMKRGNEVAKISMVETEQGFEMNDVCQKKFLSFCRAYLNRDKNYIDQSALINRIPSDPVGTITPDSDGNKKITNNVKIDGGKPFVSPEVSLTTGTVSWQMLY